MPAAPEWLLVRCHSARFGGMLYQAMAASAMEDVSRGLVVLIRLSA